MVEINKEIDTIDNYNFSKEKLEPLGFTVDYEEQGQQFFVTCPDNKRDQAFDTTNDLYWYSLGILEGFDKRNK